MEPLLSWDDLRRQARQIENELELKLSTLAKLGASTSRQASPSSDNNKAGQELEIEQLLQNVSFCKPALLEETIAQMSQVLDRPSATPTNPSMLHMLERHKNILYDYTKEFRKVKANMKAARDRMNLMTQVEDEIRTYNAGDQTADYYLSERGRIEQSHRMTDMIIDQAYATRQDISNQGRSIQGFNHRLRGVIGQIPSINNLIHRINTRRKRDTLIMAGVISTCVILILMYWLRT
ncbi:V-snare-domain-containing protein [Hesseltinella vesiculosa]|uniref:Golgi SNAP receptor complex member 1 n=1 Tax=Hesseltinella vesiculosa TaxID=101127 RepID=A0A1X2GCF6_9FUNG|nr:V-snare-domain-containing protein [Hesseltinella vesiculosa]